MIYELNRLNVSKNLNVTTTFQPHDRSQIRCAKFFKPPQNRPHLMAEIGFEAQKDPLLYVFVTVFSVDRAQTTIGFEFCMSS